MDFVLGADYNVLRDPQLVASGIAALLARAFQGESVRIPAARYDVAALRGEGPVRWVTARAHAIKEDAGSIVEVMLMHEDITDKIAAENALRIREERFRSLVLATSQIVWSNTPDGGSTKTRRHGARLPARPTSNGANTAGSKPCIRTTAKRPRRHGFPVWPRSRCSTAATACAARTATTAGPMCAAYRCWTRPAPFANGSAPIPTSMKPSWRKRSWRCASSAKSTTPPCWPRSPARRASCRRSCGTATLPRCWSTKCGTSCTPTRLLCRSRKAKAGRRPSMPCHSPTSMRPTAVMQPGPMAQVFMRRCAGPTSPCA
jgi:hypothetical protein